MARHTVFLLFVFVFLSSFVFFCFWFVLICIIRVIHNKLGVMGKFCELNFKWVAAVNNTNIMQRARSILWYNIDKLTRSSDIQGGGWEHTQVVGK